MKKILGISGYYHDSAAALIIGGQIVAAAQEERFTRKKNTDVFPARSIRFCLEQAGLDIDELDAIVFYEKPLLKFERLLETYYAFSPRGVQSFLKAIPVWLNEKLFLKKILIGELKAIGNYDKKRIPLLFSEHHLSHAASAFYPSSFEKSAILTIDGVGEWCTAAIGSGDGRDITIHKELRFPHSVGLLYSAFTYYLGFRVNSGEYKLMGLAPFGDPGSPQTRGYIEKIRTQMIDIKSDGSVWLNQAFFRYATGLRMTKDKQWEKLLGFPRRAPESAIEQHHSDLALAIQTITEEMVLKMAVEAQKITGMDTLCLAGGVALNGVAAGKLLKAGIFRQIYIQPAAGDAGGALGAALAVYYLYFEQERKIDAQKDTMEGAFLGPAYSDKTIEQMARRQKAVFQKYTDFHQLAEKIATALASGKIVGWFQGRMEYGPRALGNRSILADARRVDMQTKLNQKIKNRESFRPFAPAVLYEDMGEYFDSRFASPYMSFVVGVRENRRKALPENFHLLPLKEKLSVVRSDVPAVTHLDYSARVQTVHRETNPRFWELLTEYKRQTGCSLLVNTSFNVRSEPIVCTPEDAYRCFQQTEMDILVVGDYVFFRESLG
ncbi:MAG: carbamoyltransferase [Bacteroidia bacterium]